MSAFQGATNTTINGGNFIAVLNTTVDTNGAKLSLHMVALLFSHSATGGLLDAAERFDAPRCDEGTRLSMLRGLRNFVQDGGSSSSPSLYWLHGPAGVGKSALCQSISLSLNSEGDHAASFFFSRNSPRRNNGNQLILTLTYQLIINFPPLRHFVSKAMKKNPAILTSSNAVQMQSLIIDPVNQWQRSYRRLAHTIRNINKKPHPRLILVDGLDECSDPDVQRDLILCIASAVRQLSLPFRFVISSRPEPHILATFELDSAFQGLDGVKIVKQSLGDDEEADKQITTFLLKQFAEIQRAHPIRGSLPQPWPLPSQIAQLVIKSSGGFIYPVTVIRYISMPHNRPDECLERILGLSAIPTRDKPYESLDRLYGHIFESVPDANKKYIWNIFHFLVMPHAMKEFITPRIIERQFSWKPGHVKLVLRDLLCLVAYETHNDPIKILHASLPDFLLDPSRSGSLCIDVGNVHSLIATSFHLLFAPGDRLQAPIFGEFLDHLMQANMTNSLLQVLGEFNLVEEYRSTTEIRTPDGGWLRVQRKDLPTDTFLRCVTFLISYLLVLIIKDVPISHIMSTLHALETFVIQRYPFAAFLHAIDNEILEDIIPALQNCAVSHPKCIRTNFQFDAFLVHTDIVKDIWRLYLLLLSPFFTLPAEDKRLSMRDDIGSQLIGAAAGYSEVASALLSFLISGTRPPLSTSKSYHLDQGSVLLGALALQIITVALERSPYSTSLIFQLTQFLGAVRYAKRIDDNEFLVSSFEQLASIIMSHCTRVQLEASATLNQSQLKQLDDLIMHVQSHFSINADVIIIHRINTDQE